MSAGQAAGLFSDPCRSAQPFHGALPFRHWCPFRGLWVNLGVTESSADPRRAGQSMSSLPVDSWVYVPCPGAHILGMPGFASRVPRAPPSAWSGLLSWRPESSAFQDAAGP